VPAFGVSKSDAGRDSRMTTVGLCRGSGSPNGRKKSVEWRFGCRRLRRHDRCNFIVEQ
jgi:hypothetical protein